MKKTNFFVPLMALMLLTSCDKNAEVKQFMNELATAVSTNDKAAIEKMYPDATKADSLSLTFDADKAQIEELEGGGWKVDLGEGKDIIVVKNEADGTLSVKESHGMFVYPKEKIDFGQKTGLINSGMNDRELALQFGDTLFINYLSQKVKDAIMRKLRVKTSVISSNYEFSEYNKYRITVRNDNDFDIPAEAYEFVVEKWGWDCENLRDCLVSTELQDGPDLKANETTICPVPGEYDFEYETVKASIQLKNSKEQIVEKLFTPQGGEYEEYLESRRN